MSSVEIENVHKIFGTTHVIRDVSIDVPDGSFVVLVGPSGCGKSTLLRMIAGLEEISAGEIKIGARVINEVQPKHRNIAMVFQNYALYPHMTVAENMGFSLRLARHSKDEIATKVRDAAQILGLSNYLERFPRELSGGQRQRVAMGRAIVRDPEVFLFDEPLSNLDAKLRVQMRAELKEIHGRLKTTTIYVTHDQIEAMTMADKIVVMRDGVVEQLGDPLTLYDRPVNMFVAGFIGSPSINFVGGRIARTDGAAKFLSHSGVRWQVDPRVAEVAGGTPVTYGIRPEHFALATDGESGTLPAVVVTVEPTGAETHVVADIGEDRITAVLRERVSARPGEKIHLRPDPAQAHLFESESTLRIQPSGEAH
ncbi:ABC transporter ATP-binding protein [Roseitranquillus sediminis]|uniref:ABC transporter ATP-binding protein n=1 Tax=Roseitranquillus sediminis TaxID=2809051 RepID=UPI001D0C1D7C|nr:sn-glycerol-3-phosphate ABC transporter ATP-binding protein UgpC [Roseitranquillus sediminis]MBM9595439.1 sn-glycerol-3-phosphate ABC transporter ATP-binding protein UgpC [Roseitranquillus sediminis]